MTLAARCFPAIRPNGAARRPARCLAVLLGAIALALSSLPASAAWDLQQLMDALARNKAGRASFVETKYIAMLDQPLESSGELLYTAPDRLEKRTLTPAAESMLVNGDELLIERGRQKLRLQLQSYPELAALIESMRGTLAGDRKALERNFRLSLAGPAEHWTLQLLPLDERMLALVRRIQMTGVQEQLTGVEITQADGDRSIMRIENRPR